MSCGPTTRIWFRTAPDATASCRQVSVKKNTAEPSLSEWTCQMSDVGIEFLLQLGARLGDLSLFIFILHRHRQHWRTALENRVDLDLGHTADRSSMFVVQSVSINPISSRLFFSAFLEPSPLMMVTLVMMGAPMKTTSRCRQVRPLVQPPFHPLFLPSHLVPRLSTVKPITNERRKNPTPKLFQNRFVSPLSKCYIYCIRRYPYNRALHYIFFVR